MRLTFLALCLVGTLFASPAAADLIEILFERMSPPLRENGGAIMMLEGDQFTATVGLFGQGVGKFQPQSPYTPGTLIHLEAGRTGGDTFITFVYKGQTQSGNSTQGDIQFVTDAFVVPQTTGSPLVSLPFVLSGSISGAGGIHGVGNANLLFTNPGAFTIGGVPLWGGLAADFVIATPEPSAVVLLLTALGGLGVCAWRHMRFRRSFATGHLRAYERGQRDDRPASAQRGP